MDDTDLGTLAITLKEGDSFTIGTDIEVIVAGKTLTRTKLVVKAPKKLRVSRIPKVKRDTKKGGK